MRTLTRPVQTSLSSHPSRLFRPTTNLKLRIPAPQVLRRQQRNASRWVRTTPFQRFRDRFRDSWDEAKREYPISLSLGIIFAVGSCSLAGFFLYDDYKRIAPQYAGYPLPVEGRLRLALHHTHIDPDPNAAAKYFSEAIKAAEECEMASFSKEFMGIRIRYAQMLEHFGFAKAAVDVLNEISVDCEKKLGELDNTAKPPEVAGATNPPVTRKELLRYIIESKVKVASLYEGDYIQDPMRAKQTLSDTVGLLVRESKDPQSNGFTEDNGAGMSLAEIASILSQMGDLYATSGEEANAVQVYMLALQPLRAACNGTRSCKEVQVLSNIASTMTLAMKKPNAKINGKPVTKESLAAARRATLQWCDQAIATADLVSPESCDEICELGFLSAQMTRAELLLDSGDMDKAKATFRSLLPTLRERALHTLIEVAEQGLEKASA